MKNPIGARVNVTSAITPIYTAEQDGAYLTIRNSDTANAIDLGNESVINGSGYTLIAGSVLTLYLEPGQSIYGRAPAGQTVIIHTLTQQRP